MERTTEKRRDGKKARWEGNDGGDVKTRERKVVSSRALGEARPSKGGAVGGRVGGPLGKGVCLHLFPPGWLPTGRHD